MYAIDVKKIMEKRMERELTVSEGPVPAVVTVRNNDDDMELALFGGTMVIVFDKVKITDPTGLELMYQGTCVASLDVREWGE